MEARVVHTFSSPNIHRTPTPAEYVEWCIAQLSLVTTAYDCCMHE